MTIQYILCVPHHWKLQTYYFKVFTSQLITYDATVCVLELERKQVIIPPRTQNYKQQTILLLKHFRLHKRSLFKSIYGLSNSIHAFIIRHLDKWYESHKGVTSSGERGQEREKIKQPVQFIFIKRNSKSFFILISPPQCRL